MEVGRDSRIKVGRNRQNWIEVGRDRDRSIETVFQTGIEKETKVEKNAHTDKMDKQEERRRDRDKETRDRNTLG